MTLKQEIETQILADMEARLNNKIDAISKIVENKKAKNLHQQQSNLDMSLSSSSSSEPPSNHKAKGNQCRPYKVHPPKEKIELSKYNGSEDQCVAWLNKEEEYFDIYNIQSGKEKVKYVSMHMEGYTYNWYLWWKRDKFSYTWNLFKNVFLIVFKESEKMNFSVNLPDYNKSEMLSNSHINGNPYQHEYLGCLTNKDLKNI